MDSIAEIVGEIRDFVEKFPGVKKSYIKRKKAQRQYWHVRDSVMIKVWANEEQFDAQNVLLKLSENSDFKREIEKISKGVVVPQFDIYFT